MEDVFPFKDHNTQSVPHTTPTFQNPMFSPKSDDPIDDTLPKPIILPNPILMDNPEEIVEIPKIQTSGPPVTESVHLRRSNRNTSTPKWLKGFVGPKTSVNSAMYESTYPSFL